MARAGPFKNRFSEKNYLTLESLLPSLCSIGESSLQSVVPLVSSFHSYYISKLALKYKKLCRSVMFQRCNYNTTKLTQSHTKQPSYWRRAWSNPCAPTALLSFESNNTTNCTAQLNRMESERSDLWSALVSQPSSQRASAPVSDAVSKELRCAAVEDFWHSSLASNACVEASIQSQRPNDSPKLSYGTPEALVL